MSPTLAVRHVFGPSESQASEVRMTSYVGVAFLAVSLAFLIRNPILNSLIRPMFGTGCCQYQTSLQLCEDAGPTRLLPHITCHGEHTVLAPESTLTCMF